MAEKKPTQLVSSPIIHTPRSELRDALRQELKSLGAASTIIPSSGDDCIEQLIKNPQSILVLDWESGSVEVNQILGACKGHFHIETRPSFLVVPEVDPNVIATGYEYGVSQIHSGPISRLTIRECLEAMLHEDETTSMIKEVMIHVAQTRSQGDWSLATPLLVETWEKFPENERLAVELAENLIFEEAWDRAMEVLGLFVEKDPPVVRALHLMGRCLMQMGEYDRAIGLLGRAKIINPHNVDRLIDLGNAFLNNDQIDEARDVFDEAVELDGKNKDAVVGKGQCLLMSGEVNEALGLLKAVSGPREMASIFNTAAVLTMRSGHFDKGMNLYRSALAALGRNDRIGARLYFNMGIGFKRWNKLEKALTCFSKSYELDNTYGKAMRHKESTAAKIAAGGGVVSSPQGCVAHDQFQEEEFGRVKPAGEPVGLETFDTDEDEDGGGFDP
jgi:tetratricopeptide (TPR) repeat protein